MQLRYLAAAGPPQALAQVARGIVGRAAPAFTAVLRAPTLAVWTTPQTPAIAGGNEAVAVGLLSDRASGQRVDSLPMPLPSERQFTARFWGAYVLFALESGDRHLVLRDPSGGVTAYHRRSGALDLYASDCALLAEAAPEPLEPDLAFLRHWLTFPSLRGQRTGARGVSEVVPGTSRRSAGKGGTVLQCWQPADHARPDRAIRDFDTAAALLRETVLHVTSRLTAESVDPVVRLSGGLDSSIVAAALADAECSFRAVTFATRSPDGDERVHARAVARHCGIELAELVEEPVIPDFDHVPPLALRPLPNALLQPLHHAVERHLALAGADLVLDGTGGDNVFCYINSASPALDAFRRGGARAGVAALGDVARLHGTTLWAVVRAARKRWRRAPTTWQRDDTFLAPDAAATQAAYEPWLNGLAAAGRGKFEHVQSIVGIRQFLADPAPGGTAALHPLLAQPVLEACLRIPAWLWVKDGRDRAVARAAFRGLLPASILARRSKGSLGSMFVSGYMAGRARLEPLLLEGRLAALGLLDRDAIRDYLRRDGEPGDASYVRLLDLSAAESWLRSFDA